MSKLSPERRKVVLIGGGIAAGSCAIALLTQNHPVFGWIWLAILLLAAAYAATQLVKIKKQRQRAKR